MYSIIFLGAMYLGNRNFLVYHTLVELHSVIVGLLILTISINTHRVNKDKGLILLGIAYGFIACFDLMHLLTYKGMGIFADDAANIPIQLWIIARYMESLSFLAYLLIPSDRINFRKAIFLYASVAIFSHIAIFYLNIFPDCYMIGSGLTSFKVISEYIISWLLIFCVIIF